MSSQPWPRSNNNNHIQSQLYESGAEGRDGGNAWVVTEFSAKRYQWTAHLLHCSFRTYTVCHNLTVKWSTEASVFRLATQLLALFWHYHECFKGWVLGELLEWVLEVWEPCLFLVHPMLPDFILPFNCKSTQTCSSFSCFLSSVCSSIAKRKTTKTYV